MNRTVIASLSLSAAALVGLAVHEGYREESYIPVKGDRPTIGFGDAQGIQMGQRTDPVRALIRLNEHVGRFERELKSCIGNAPMFQHEWDAMVSLAYNVGSGAVCTSSIPAKLRSGQYEAACRTILDFNGMCVKRNGVGKCIEKKVLPGLVNRRQQEHKMCTGR